MAEVFSTQPSLSSSMTCLAFARNVLILVSPGRTTQKRCNTLLGITPHAKIAAMEHFFFKHICKAPGGSSDVFINRSDRMVPLSIRGNRHPRKSVADHRNAAWSGTQHA